MVANIRGYTPNYNFKLINFDTPRWHTLEYANWNQLDAMFLQLGVPGIRGEWTNSTLYTAGERVFDIQTSDMYRCLVTHTSQPTGTFAEERSILPTYWALQTLGVPLYRGGWVPGVYYSLGDLVSLNTYTYYLCIVSHTSSTIFDPDAFFWQLVFDAKPAVDATAQSAADAEQSETDAETAATTATNAANSANASASGAATSASNAGASATDAANSATAAATSATNAAASATTAASQADALHGTSTTSNTVATGAKTFTTQAGKQFNVGNFVTIVATANPNGQMITGGITAYSGTTLTINATGTLGSGTVADWQIYVSGMQGQKGADGTGGGGIADAPSDGVLYGRVNATWQASVKRGGDTMAGMLTLFAAPTVDLHAATKKYADDLSAAISGAVVLKDGSVAMTGQLSLPISPAPVAANAVRKDYVDSAIAAIVIPTVPAVATAAEYLSNAAGAVGKIVSPKTAWDALALVTVAPSGITFTIDMNAGIDFNLTLTAPGMTVGNPSNPKIGQKGIIYLSQDATGSRTISSWGTAWKFPGGIKPLASTAANSVDAVSYVVTSAGFICCNFSAGFA